MCNEILVKVSIKPVLNSVNGKTTKTTKTREKITQEHPVFRFNNINKQYKNLESNTNNNNNKIQAKSKNHYCSICVTKSKNTKYRIITKAIINE